VKLSAEHQVTVEAGQDDPNGPELAVPDQSLLGNPIKIEKTKGGKGFNKGDPDLR
jgi:hypothetical protein